MRILIVDDHAVVREGVRRLLAVLPGAEIYDAKSVEEGLDTYVSVRPDIVVLDINLDTGSGLDLLQKLRNEDKSARIVMFTMHDDPSYAQRALRSGASGYVSKSAAADELIQAIKKVSEGERYVDQELARELALAPNSQDDPLSALTNREMEILRLLGEGKSITEIAEYFGVAYKTIANSCTRLKEKLGLERTADLIRLSIESRDR